jgi:hypothetical protein
MNVMQKKYVLLLILLFFMFPLMQNIFAYSSLSISLKTSPDYGDNVFYMYPNMFKQIYLNISSDYLPPNQYSNTLVKYFVDVYPDNPLNGSLSIELSKDYGLFTSTVDTDIALNLVSKNFKDNTVNLKIYAKLYDSYGNVLETANKYITITSKDSNNLFPLTEIDSAKKILKGYNYSRNIVYLLNNNDYDIISLTEYVDDPYIYDINCIAPKEIIINILYKGNKSFDINFSLNKDINVIPDIYFVSCVAFNKYYTYNLKDVLVVVKKPDTLNSENSSPDENVSQEPIIVGVDNNSDNVLITSVDTNASFLNRTSSKLNEWAQNIGLNSGKDLLLIIIGVIILILIIFLL